MWKKIICIILILVLLCSTLSACDTSDNAEHSYMQPEMKGEIRVNVYQSAEWLEMAAQMFEEKYPDMKVQIEAFYNGTDTYVVENGGVSMTERPAGQTREDYAVWLNTHLMSGDAGDIVITSDGLAVDKYKNMGAFEDLSPYLGSAKEINSENCYMNLFDAYRTDSGELYQFPVSAMACPLLTFDKKIIEETGYLSQIQGKSLTWREALTLSEEMYDDSTIPGKTLPEARTILGNLFAKEVVASVDYTKGRVNLREKELLEILEAFDEFDYYDTYMWDEDTFEVFDLVYTEDTFIASLAADGDCVAVQWKQMDGKVHLSPYFATDFAIYSKSKNKDLAWEFLKFLLSDEVQTLPAFPNAGITHNGLRARVEAYCTAYEMQAEKKEEMLKLIEGWLCEVNGYRSEDTDLIQIGDAILAEFMSGNLTAEEAVQEVSFRLEQYLSE